MLPNTGLERILVRGGKDAAVLEVEVDATRLIPDFNVGGSALWEKVFGEEEPQYDIRDFLILNGEQILEQVKAAGVSWNSAIDDETGAYSAIYIGKIEASQINVVYRPGWERR